MLSWLKKPPAAPDPPQGDAVEVGWLIDASSASFIYEPPKPALRRAPPPASAKALQRCPAVHDLEARLFSLACPIDLHLKVRNLQSTPVLVNVPGEAGSVTKSALDSMLLLMPRERWRDPNHPLLQVVTPWRFVADEPVWLSQTPAFHHYATPPLPGLVVAGRFPIHLWPRTLAWAFEWHDTKQDLVIRRGDPWFCVGFETVRPGSPIDLFEAEMTDALREYCRGLDGVTSYVNQTHRLLETAAGRRPTRLLHRKVRS